MPSGRNLRGGKAYKKGKKPLDADSEIARNKFSGAEAAQTYGRAVRMLGDRRVLCFCNDGYERVCKIRGALCKGRGRQKIEVGDIVLLSFRDFEEGAEGTAGGDDDAATGSARTINGRKEIADIIGKYERHHWREIRREVGIHPCLFAAEADTTVQHVEDDIFEDGSGSDSDSGSGSGSGLDVDAI
jgi:initiation factor 1A